MVSSRNSAALELPYGPLTKHPFRHLHGHSRRWFANFRNPNGGKPNGYFNDFFSRVSSNWCMHLELPGQRHLGSQIFRDHRDAVGFVIEKDKVNIRSGVNVSANITWHGGGLRARPRSQLAECKKVWLERYHHACCFKRRKRIGFLD